MHRVDGSAPTPDAVRPETPRGVTRRQRPRDAAVALVCAIGLVWSLLAQDLAWSVLPSWWKPLDLAGGVLAAVVLLVWRRRAPVRVALVLGVVGGLFLSAGVPTLVSVWTVGTRRGLRPALLVSAAHLAVAIPYYLVFPIITEGLLVWTVMLVLLYGLVLTAGVAARSRRQVIDNLVEASERDRREYEVRLAAVRSAERARIAREMHDVLAHRMSLLSMHAGALEYRTAGGAPRPSDEELRESVAVIRQNAHRALEELGEVLSVLRDEDDGRAAEDHDPSRGRPQPLVTDLPQLVREAEDAGQRVRLRVDGGAEALAVLRPQVHRTLYRAVQEGLTNARKHAPGAEVEVEVGGDPRTGVVARVRNALPLGVGGAEVLASGRIPGSGAGLAGLGERVRVDGGTVRTAVADGLFELTVELPWRT